MLRIVWFAPLMVALAGGCGSRGQVPGDGGLAGAGGAPGAGAWIYVATDRGVDRVKAAGGAPEPFGISADTRSVFPSPSGQLVAQELADQRVAVFAADGSARATFDVRMGLLGWSDEETLLFLDRQTKFLQQTSVDGQTRRYLPLPAGLKSYGYLDAMVSPDRSLLVARAEPLGTAQVSGFYLLVLSAVDGTLVRELGVQQGPVAWTGDGRLVMRPPSGSGFVALAPRSGESTPVTGASALSQSCGFVSWYETGKVLLGKDVTSGDTGRCVPSATFDVDTAESSPFSGSYLGSTSTSGLVVPPFAQSADGREAVVAGTRELELGAVAGGERRSLGTARGQIVGVSWAHPTGGTAGLVAPPKPPGTVPGLAGAPPIASRTGGTDCRAGRWVNRTPTPLPAGWPGPWGGSSFAFDTERGTLLVEGAYTDAASIVLGTLPNLGYETMEWNGAEGRWSNLSRPDGFGPAGGRAMTFDRQRKVVLAFGAEIWGDGPWTWTPVEGWQNLRAEGSVRPYGINVAASVYDVGRDRWLISGGYASSATWEWDGASWQMSTAPPPGGTTQLAGSALVYDDKRAQVYSVGNRDRGAAPWLYEPAQNRWTAMPSSGSSPLPRDWAGVAYDARRDRVMVFGGYESDRTAGDLAEWDPGTGAWQACPATGAVPGRRMNAALVYDVGRDVLVLLGGRSEAGLADPPELWEWYVP